MRVALPLSALVMLTACLASSGRDEVASEASPDGSVRAVLFETNGGATTAFGYEIALMPTSQGAGAAVAAGELYGAARSRCSWGVNLRWLSPTELAVEFMEADRSDIPKRVQVGAKQVTIVKRPGVSDETAPCGGMLANLG